MDYFKAVKFFSIPEEDLQGPIRDDWEDTVKKLNEGVMLKGVQQKNRIIIRNNFIKKSNQMICHVRFHEVKADYSEGGPHADKLPTQI